MINYLSKEAADTTASGIEYTITPHGSRALLKLDGDLRVGWAASLAQGLTQLDINIISGTAVKESALWWISRFEIEPVGPAPRDLTTLDIASFFKGSAVHSSIPAINLHAYRLELCSRHGGSLEVEISGTDSIGFLAGILRQFSFYSLFPVEMELETRGKLAHDRFWLKCIGNVSPLAEDVACIKNRLKGMTGD